MAENNIKQITSKDSHDAIALAGEQGSPTVIYVSFSPLPVCRAFTPKFEAIAANPAFGNVVFAQMELDKETTSLVKFGVQTCPILILIRKGWSKTLLTDNAKVLEQSILEELIGKI